MRLILQTETIKGQRGKYSDLYGVVANHLYRASSAPNYIRAHLAKGYCLRWDFALWAMLDSGAEKIPTYTRPLD